MVKTVDLMWKAHGCQCRTLERRGDTKDNPGNQSVCVYKLRKGEVGGGPGQAKV